MADDFYGAKKYGGAGMEFCIGRELDIDRVRVGVTECAFRLLDSGFYEPLTSMSLIHDCWSGLGPPIMFL